MNTISKTLVVFVTVASLAFLGFAAVNLLGGPNWEADLQELTEYSYEKSDGPVPEWTLTHRQSGDKVQTSRVLAELVAAALKDQTQRQQAQVGELQEAIPRLESGLAQAKALNARDRAAMQAREQVLAQRLKQIDDQVNEAALAGINTYRQAMAVRDVAERRREDVFRLEDQLAEIEVNVYQIIEQKRRLQDLLIQYRGVNERLEQRNGQLQQQLNPTKPPYDETRADDATALVLPKQD